MVVLTMIGTLVVVFPIFRFIFIWLTTITTRLLDVPLASASLINIVAGLLSGTSVFIAFKQFRISVSDKIKVGENVNIVIK